MLVKTYFSFDIELWQYAELSFGDLEPANIFFNRKFVDFWNM
jgi:hypothetical protein